MTTLVKGPTTGGFLVWEVLRDYTRETVTLASGAGKLTPGTVLGRITSGGKYTVLTPGASNGSQNAAGLLWGAADATDADGGAARSKHLDGTAFDIAMSNHDPVAFEQAARAVGFLGFGFYPRSGFIHIDLGPARTWGGRFPVRATAFAEETPPVRETLADSRTMKGSSAAD